MTGDRVKPAEEEDGREIFVNKKKFRVEQRSLKGAQILQLVGYNVNEYDLFLVRGQTSEKIDADQSVEIENGMHFNALLKSVPYGTVP